MRLKNLGDRSRFTFLMVAFFTVTATSGATVRVGGASLRANGELAQGFQYAGSCPVALKFSWGVIGTEPTAVSYTFVRSDGGHQTTSRTISLPNANQSVPIYYDWQLGANTPQFQNYSGWVELDVESPNPVQYKLPFTVHCGGS